MLDKEKPVFEPEGNATSFWLDTRREKPVSEVQRGRGALAAGGLAAILASTCCLGPLVLVTLGFSGAWIGNLTVL